MDIVLENPSVPPSARAPTAPTTAATATSQLGLPMCPPQHFSHRAAYDADSGRSPPTLPADEYYARSSHGLVSYGDLDGASAPVTVRRVDKSGLLEIAETDPVTCPRPCVLTGAEDIGVRPVSLRVDRSGLLEAVPEAVDQPEEHCSDGNATILDEAAAVSRREPLRMNADVNPRVFNGGCCLLERPSSLEGQACPDEADEKSCSADAKVLNGSSRAQFDVSSATERLPRLPFSPGPSLRRPRSDSSRLSPLVSRCADADPARRIQKSPEVAAKYSPANSTIRKLTNSSHSPITRGRSQAECSKDSLDPALIDSDDGPAVIGASKTLREPLLAGGSSTEQEENVPPGEERAEAEGCEHTTTESHEDKVSFKGSKLLDNDNVQTLKVIILSEQL